MSPIGTKLLYFFDQTLTSAKARVLQINAEESGLAVVLDQTVFYVQGGGQPGDRGTISTQDSTFSVSKTIRDANGNALHLGQFTKGELSVGCEVHLDIDQPLRQEHSRLHSAGHLIDLAVDKIGLKWGPGKGCHFPGSCCVEYKTHNDEDHDLKALQVKLQQEYERLVQADLPVIITIEEDGTSGGLHGLPLRQVAFAGGKKCPCGGTHVPSSSHLHGITITKLKFKNGMCKVNYQ